MTRAMLLCAGFGTRLGELSDERPKPLLPVCDVPIVRYGIANLVGLGITDIVINTHHKAELFEGELGDGSELGARIQYSHEEVILGTGGGLKSALHLLDPNGDDEPFVSMNGKLIFDIDVRQVVEAYNAQPDLLGMMVVRRVPDALEWGAVDVRADGAGGALRVRNVLESGHHMFCGVHVTRPSVMAKLPEGEACSIRQGYLPWMHSGVGEVGAWEVPDGIYFAEHSTPERYLQSSLDLLAATHLCHPPADLTGTADSARIADSAEIIGPVRIGPNATIGSGARIGPGAVIGANATIGANSRIQDAVVWRDATVPDGTTHRRAIITPNAVVSLSDAVA